MAYTIVETPNAKYLLVFGKHSIENLPPALNFDALVIEGTTEGTPKSAMNEPKDPHYLINNAVAKGKEIWLVDPNHNEETLRKYRQTLRENTPTKVKGRITTIGNLLSLGSAFSYLGIKAKSKNPIPRRQAVKTILTALALGLIPQVPSKLAKKVIDGPKINDGEIKNDLFWDLFARAQEKIYGKEMILIRNAIVAEKSEFFLAPRLREKLGRKPVIAMNWGAGHYGIKGLLKNSKKRNKILRKNKLEKYSTNDYWKSYRIHTDSKGHIIKVEEFKNTINLKKNPKRKPQISRRQFFKSFRRKV